MVIEISDDQEFLFEGGKPRLEKAQAMFLGEWRDRYDLKREDLQALLGYYVSWLNFHEYLVLCQEISKSGAKIEKKFLAVKCSKRGNDVYLRRVDRKIGNMDKKRVLRFFDDRANVKRTHLLFVSLTWDTKLGSVRQAWENIGKDFNRWITNLRQKFGRISYFRTWEASEKGYPHVHVLMYFHDSEFKVFRDRCKHRIDEKHEFERSWHSFVDVEACSSLKMGIGYVSKYLKKMYSGVSDENEIKTQVLTFAMCWIFRKRSYAVGGFSNDDDHSVVSPPGGRVCRGGFFRDLISDLRNSKFLQVDLNGDPAPWEISYVFLGVVPGGKLDLKPEIWVYAWDRPPPGLWEILESCGYGRFSSEGYED